MLQRIFTLSYYFKIYTYDDNWVESEGMGNLLELGYQHQLPEG